VARGRRQTAVTRWNLDPALLSCPEFISFEQLLVLIRERDAQLPLPETREEAIRILSKDFLGRREG
jgi:hypothetical protein